MAVAHDAASESHTGASGSVNEASFTWTHTPVGTPAGVLVFTIETDLTATPDEVTSVTYGGTALTKVTGGSATDTAAEFARTTAWLLDSSVPTGAQSVVVNRNNNGVEIYAVAITVTADTDVEVKGTPVLLQEDGTYTEQSVDSGADEALRYAAGMHGNVNPPDTGANSTLLHDIDLGGRGHAVVRETTGGSGSRLVGFTDATSDDRAAVHLALGEASAADTFNLYEQTSLIGVW